MKKLIVTLASVLLLATGINAAEKETFYPGWNFGVQAGASYTRGLGQFNTNYLSYPTIGLNAGYEFLPWFGLRADLSGWQAKGMMRDLLYTDVTKHNFYTDDAYKFNYVQLALDAMFDICNMFKYRSERFCSPYIFLGAALNLRFNNGALDYKSMFPAGYEYLWKNSTLAFAARVGVGANFRINDKVKLSLEIVDNVLPESFNSVCDNYHEHILNVKPSTWDNHFSALLGVKFTFGQAKKKAEALASAAAAAAAAKAAADKAAREKAAREKAAREKAAREKAEAERLAAERAAAAAAAAKAKALQDAKNAVAAALDVDSAYPRFVIGKYSLTKDAKAKVAAAAEVLKVNPDVKVLLTGYADKETGSAAGNMKLSENRSKAIADALVAAGVPANQLETAWKGDTEIPFAGAKPAAKRTVTFKVL